MNSNKLNFKSEKLFPKQFQFAGLLSVFTGIGLVISSPILSPFLILMGVLLITSYSGIEFDILNKNFRKYYSFLFFKSGKYKSYEAVEKLYINESSMRQRIYSNSNTSTVAKYREYNSYLKFSDGTKLFLRSSKDKKKLTEALSSLEELFVLNIVDNTTD